MTYPSVHTQAFFFNTDDATQPQTHIHVFDTSAFFATVPVNTLGYEIFLKAAVLKMPTNNVPDSVLVATDVVINNYSSSGLTNILADIPLVNDTDRMVSYNADLYHPSFIYGPPPDTICFFLYDNYSNPYVLPTGSNAIFELWVTLLFTDPYDTPHNS